MIKEHSVDIAVKQGAEKLKSFLKKEGAASIKSKGKNISFLVSAEDEKVYKLMNKIFAKGFMLTHLEVKAPSLDDIFIKIARQKK
jgi:ABC-type uncharacterized transport system ATPase subunit